MHLFRSYGDSGHPSLLNHFVTSLASDEDRVLIWEAARATSAAPHYFREVTINGNVYMDGGIRNNNPSYSILREARDFHRLRPWAERHAPDANGRGPVVGVIVSIGTGRSAPLSMFSRGNILQRIHAIGKYAVRNLTDPEVTHQQMADHTNDLGIPYFRFNVETGLENMKMDEMRSDTIQRIQDATRDYLQLDETKKQLRRCANYLVAHRRGRCRTDVERAYWNKDHFSRPGPAPISPLPSNGYLNGFSRREGRSEPTLSAPYDSPQFHQPGNARGRSQTWGYESSSTISRAGLLFRDTHELSAGVSLGYGYSELPDHRQDPQEVPATPRVTTRQTFS